MAYTITITEEQKQIIAAALSKFSEFTLGQRTDERETARKLEPMIGKLSQHGNNDLTK